MVRLDAADRDERVAALRERVGSEVLELPDLVAAVCQARVAIVALRPDLNPSTQILLEPFEPVDRRRAEEQRHPVEISKTHRRQTKPGRVASVRAYALRVLDALVWATDIDVLPPDRVVEKRDDYVLARSPSNPDHYWGNFLVFAEPPAVGDGERWEAAFEAEFSAEPTVRHRTFAWDTTDGSLGRAEKEFVVRGYELEQTVGLIATPSRIRPHARENRDVEIRSLAAEAGEDEELWHQVVEVQVAGRDDSFEETSFRAFRRQRRTICAPSSEPAAAPGTSRFTRERSSGAVVSSSPTAAAAYRRSTPPMRTGAGGSARAWSSRLHTVQVTAFAPNSW